MKRIVWYVIVGSLTYMLIDGCHESWGYTVKKGDTVSGIAQKELGDWRKWEDIAKWNELSVEWKKGIAYIWIKPGQQMILVPPSKVVDPADIVRYINNTKTVMENEIFRMAGIRKRYMRSTWNEIPVYLYVDKPQLTRIRLLEWARYMEHQSRYKMVDEIFNWAMADTDYPFKKSDRYWVDHRKMSLMLLALLDIESNGFFVKGKHGERGPWQIKTSTYSLVMGAKDDIDFILMTDSEAGLRCAIKILQSEDSPLRAFAHYNRGSNRWKYANKVLAAYYKMMGRAERLDEI